MRHKHYDCIVAWAEGKEIEYKDPEMGLWFNWRSTSWNDDLEYRIKPKEPEWWVNIPEHGVLVKNKQTGVVICLSRAATNWYSNDWTPLTNEEIEAFKR